VPKAFFILLVVVALSCPNRSQVVRLLTPEGPPVEVGHYPDYLRILSGNDRLSVRAAALRPDIESHESVLRTIVRQRIQLKAPLEFQFKYAGYDSVHQRLVLRYFARNPNPVEIAGWEVFLVYTLPRPRLLKAFVAEVPLE